MLTRYNRELTEVDFYFTDTGKQEKYRVNLNGDVYVISPYLGKDRKSIKLKPIIKDGIKYYRIDGKLYRLANIINYAFKGLMRSVRDDYLTREIIFLDGNQNNTHPENMIWGNTNSPEDRYGFRIVPGFARYKVNRKGVVKRADNNFTYTPVETTHGYLSVSVSLDTGKSEGKNRRSVGVHRLVALAFIPIPQEYKYLDVNHIDNNPKNNCVDNLEWVSRRQNNIHAVLCGRNHQAKAVLVRDVLTGEVMEFISRRECGAFFNMHITKITNRCASRGQRVYPDYRQYCLKEEFRSWGECSAPTPENPLYSPENRYSPTIEMKPKQFIPVRVLITDESTGNETVLLLPDNAMEFFNIKDGFSYKLKY